MDAPPPDGPVFRFDAELWEAEAEASWVFVTVPTDQADEIADLAPTRRGFGSVRVEVVIGGTTWRTSVFPDRASASYILPVKRAVRDAEGLAIGDRADVRLTVLT